MDKLIAEQAMKEAVMRHALDIVFFAACALVMLNITLAWALGFESMQTFWGL